MLIAYGFTEEVSRKALIAVGNSIDKALDWIYENIE